MTGISEVWPDWNLEELLGQGGYGKVYRASRTVMGHISHSAVKIIEIPRSGSEVSELATQGLDMLSIKSFFEKRAQGILDEIEVMESLKGAPNVVGIEDYRLVERADKVGWSIYIRMELLESLDAYCRRTGNLGLRGVAKLGIDICRALEACHKKGIIHRDVKPQNIFRGEYGYKLGDFGIARRIEGSDLTLTVAGATPYMAPEVYKGEHYGYTVDIYSLGLVLYHQLNGGRAPFIPASGDFGPDDAEEARFRRLKGEPLPAPANADPRLAAIVLKACDPDPSRRWQTAGAMQTALEGWLEGEEPVGPPPKNDGEDPGTHPSDSQFSRARITLDPNGAEAAERKTVELAPGESCILPDVSMFTRNGFRAIGWSTEADGTGGFYEPNSSYRATGDNVLYVRWEAISEPVPPSDGGNGEEGTGIKGGFARMCG